MGLPSHVSARDLATLLNITVARIGQLVKEGVLARDAAGQFELTASVQAFLAFRENAASTEAGRHGGLGAERAGLVRAQRKQAELNFDKDVGLVCEVAHVRQAVDARFDIVRNRFMQLPAQVAPLVAPADPEQARGILDAEVRQILTELSAEAVTRDVRRKNGHAPPQ